MGRRAARASARAVRFVERADRGSARRPPRLLHGRHARGHLHRARAEARRGAREPRGAVRLLARRPAAHDGRRAVVRRRRAIAAAGNVAPTQMQSGFVALRPTAQIAKWVGLARPRARPEGARVVRRARDVGGRQHPVPRRRPTPRTSRSSTRRTALVRGEHHVRGRRVDLGDHHAARCSTDRRRARHHLSARPRRARSTRRAAAPTRRSSSSPAGTSAPSSAAGRPRSSTRRCATG